MTEGSAPHAPPTTPAAPALALLPSDVVYVRSADGLGVQVVTGCATGDPVTTPRQKIGE